MGSVSSEATSEWLPSTQPSTPEPMEYDSGYEGDESEGGESTTTLPTEDLHFFDNPIGDLQQAVMALHNAICALMLGLKATGSINLGALQFVRAELANALRFAGL